VTVFGVILFLGTLAVLAIVGWLALDLRQRVRALEMRLAELGAAPSLAPELEYAFDAAGRRVIAVEILNPLELAASHNKFAGIAGGLVPAMVRKIVYDQAAKIISSQLVEQGVTADVTVHALG
jgi:hypothetical protein